MAASDPTPYVATPTGTLQGVAAFSWDGSAWQPSGRAGPDVATSTGVLRGVAPFSWDGANWQPSGRAQPGVATPSGVLDGVAVYTWSGSAWTPAYGGPSCATPTGALRGVAAFNWDGSAWQPTGQARASVPTPYGVLDGVAMFNWSGAVWSAVPGSTLDLLFTTPGQPLDPRITFTRASTATYFDATGTMQTAATNGPRFDYDPVTHALRGLLIEEARTNVIFPSSAIGSFPIKTDTTVVNNSTTSPDGTVNASLCTEGTAGTAVVTSATATVPAGSTITFSLHVKRGNTDWLRVIFADTANTNGMNVWVNTALGTIGQMTLRGTATSLASSVQPAGGGWYRLIGTCTMPGGSTTAQTTTLTSDAAFVTRINNGSYYLWGVQVEQGGFQTSYIPTTSGGVVRSADVCSIPTSPWYNSSLVSLMFEMYQPVQPTGALGGFGDGATFGNSLYLVTGTAFNRGGVSQATSGPLFVGAVNRICGTLNAATVRCCTNGGAIGATGNAGGVASAATLLAFGGASWNVDGTMNGHMRRARYWPRVLSDAEMQSVTT